MAEHIASTQAPGGTEPAEASAWGIDAGGWVAIAMLVVFGIALWLKTPSLIAAMLDRKIALIRRQLDEAAQLRAEAEALRAEYQAKVGAAGAEAEAMLDRARHEAEEVVEQAKSDSAALIERRTRIAEDKIGAAERAAVAELRAKAASAAAAAAGMLLREKHDAKADKTMVDQTIAALSRP
jgi:F-type H+-transporting ATPase subunit b